MTTPDLRSPERVLSVVMPAYNEAATILEVVERVLASPWVGELVIVDDGSSDKTLQLMLDIASYDRRVRIVSQPNSGVSATRNYGAELAKGEWLAFLDADDQWTRDKLAAHRAFHDSDPLIDASFAQVAFCPERHGEMVSDRTVSSVPEGYLDVQDIVVENAICTTSNLVISREVFREIGGFDESLRYAEDQELLARLLGAGHAMRGIDRRLVRYRMSDDGLSCDFEAMLDGWRSFAGDWIGPGQLARAEAVYCRYLARRALRAGAEAHVALDFARRGLAADRATFLGTGGRGLLTLGGVLAAGAMPAALRRAVFA